MVQMTESALRACGPLGKWRQPLREGVWGRGAGVGTRSNTSISQTSLAFWPFLIKISKTLGTSSKNGENRRKLKNSPVFNLRPSPSLPLQKRPKRKGHSTILFPLASRVPQDPQLNKNHGFLQLKSASGVRNPCFFNTF